MTIKISLRNLGILRRAEFSLGDLTIICGKNNTGKTYATYALYGFLQSWRQFIDTSARHSDISDLIANGVVQIDLKHYESAVEQTLLDASEKYSDHLDNVFAATEGRFNGSEFRIQVPPPNIIDLEFEHEVGLPKEQVLYFAKGRGSEKMTVTLVVKGDGKGKFENDYAKMIATRFIISEVLFSESFPRPFIASAERTGVAIFRTELNYARNLLLKEMTEAGKSVDTRDLLRKGFQRYPQPVEENAEFIRELEEIAKRKSFITREHSELLDDFADIVNGNFQITQNGQLYFIPKGTRLRLTMDESSSTVRSLLNIGFYLRHDAKKGDLLMVDEPELNLHPENQRRIAKLFARLVNVGIKVFVTTHSDYIVKELNTLIMLNHDKPHLKRIAKENGYRDDELIKSDQVSVFVAQEDLMPLEEGQRRRRRGHTLVPADMDPKFGIEARSFDETIDDMNRILEDIVWGVD